MDERKLQVVNIVTFEIVKEINVTGRSDNSVDLIERGMLRNLNRDEYFVRDTKEEEQSHVE